MGRHISETIPLSYAIWRRHVILWPGDDRGLWTDITLHELGSLVVLELRSVKLLWERRNEMHSHVNRGSREAADGYTNSIRYTMPISGYGLSDGILQS